MKQLLSLFRRARLFLLVLGAVGFMVAAATIWRSSALQADKQAEGKRQYHARIRDGVGREVQFASPGDPSGTIRASVNSVDNFIFKRSGVKLSGTTKTRLAEMERLTLNGSTKRLSISELNDVLTSTAFERLGRLTDEEILHVDDTLRGFKAPDLPRKFARRVIYLPGRLVLISSDKFVGQLKALRDQTNTPLGEILKGATRREIADVVHRRISTLSEAVPEKFAGAWDTNNDKEGDTGVTPLQAVLLAYSVAGSDLLTGSEASLPKEMRGIQYGLSSLLGESFPSPEGHLAYGVNGYITSTPLDLVFDEQTINLMLDHIQERSAS
jgi:hypothetical protein